ncbi:MAG: shikimate kinase [Spirochaetales bacterium]|nr:shikimate kinase [Spirochaetales bacterium]
MKHTGKSTLGRLLAQKREMDFADLDLLLEAEQGPPPLLNSREIFRSLGRIRFQELEALAAKKVAQRMKHSLLVLAWGGGTIDNPEAVEALRDQGVLVHLVEAPKVLFDRILRGGLPAFLSADRPWEDFQKLYERRTAALSAICDVEFSLEGRPIDQAFQDLLNVLEDVERRNHAR